MTVPNNSPSRTWLVLVFGDDRTHAGNDGYADDIRRVYHFDSDVQNHAQVTAGDVLVFRSRHRMLGVASVATVVAQAGTKNRRRCPVCGTTKLTERTHKSPRFRCKQKHDFSDPVSEQVQCTLFEARLVNFADAEDALPVDVLREACPRHSNQMSIQELDPDAVRYGLSVDAPDAARLLPAPESWGPEAGVPHSADSTPPYEPDGSGNDERDVVNRAIRLRRGQARFRRSLAKLYDSKCMITGCELFDIVEAAHVAPYRRKADHSDANGLLLRADLHTLFDLDLLGIDPDTLEVRLHPDAAAAGYEGIAGTRIRNLGGKPSRLALQLRWDRFIARSAAD